MTKIVFFRENGHFYGFEEQGHTGFGESGNDILCAALSAMTMLIINTLEISFAADVDYHIDEGATNIKVRCAAALPRCVANGQKNFAVSGLFQGYFYQLNDLTEEYYDYLEVDVIDRPYKKDEK